MRLGPADYAGALLCWDERGALKVLDAHRKWLDVTLPAQFGSGNMHAVAVDEKGGLWLSGGEKLVYIQAKN